MSILTPVERPFIKPVSNAVFKFAVSIKLCPTLTSQLPTTRHDAASYSAAAPAQPPTPADADAERRRALALRALDVRLSEPVAAPVSVPIPPPVVVNDPPK
ncbi:hypothetical protein HDU87_000507 [Geranomyces variabilis]|uniref:Uncharacterized protein n=1 Tax=Geranomyces variabilis TaxID=109894 RepID=A0AAD5XLS5_9FUNG|nr:hypothetical protein HDU87_000507 [Geranomyces variabilis]